MTSLYPRNRFGIASCPLASRENVVAESLDAGQNPPVPEAITGVVGEAGVRRAGDWSRERRARSTLPGDARGRLSHRGPRTRQFDARCGGCKCSTIRCLVYSRVVFPVLVLQTRVSIQSGRSCFSICREPQLDAGHPLASQQRWCDESYHPAHLRGLPKPSGHGPNHGLCQVIWACLCGELHPNHSPVDTHRPASEGVLHDHR